jgi:glucose-1-phosphate thymidylyltransferase
LLQAGLREILIISSDKDIISYQNLLNDGSQFGVEITYATQNSPNGIAEAFIIGNEFIGSDCVCLILGDNIFIGENFAEKFPPSSETFQGAKVYGYQVADPERFGVISNDNGNIEIEEKPIHPKSSYAVTGLYFYDNSVIQIAKDLRPSDRGELEITDVNIEYLKSNKLQVEFLDEGFTWFDAGTHDAMIEAGIYVQTIQKRQGVVIACPEAIAYRNGWITSQKVSEEADKYNNHYGMFLKKVISETDI